jgi:plasmid stability protein
MPNVSVSDEVHERLRIRAHRTGRSMSHVADRLLIEALDRLDDGTAIDESAAALDLIAAVARKDGAEAGFQALLLEAGASERNPGRHSP